MPKLWTLLQGVDCVYHLAARVLVPESILYPREYNAVNVGGTVAVMEAMRDAGVKRVVFTSSGAVYGEQEAPAGARRRAPQSRFALRRQQAGRRALCPHHRRAVGHRDGDLARVQRLRAGTALPPAHAPVIPQFLKQALGGGSLVVFGDGRQSRDFVYVDDVVEGLVAAATAKNVDRQIINIGSGTDVSINALVDKIGRVTGRKVSPAPQRRKAAASRGCAPTFRRRSDCSTLRPRLTSTRVSLTLERDPRFKRYRAAARRDVISALNAELEVTHGSTDT